MAVLFICHYDCFGLYFSFLESVQNDLNVISMIFFICKIEIYLLVVRAPDKQIFAASRYAFYLAIDWIEKKYASYHFIVFILAFCFPVVVRNILCVPALENAKDSVVVKTCSADIKLSVYGIDFCQPNRESLVRILGFKKIGQFKPYK